MKKTSQQTASAETNELEKNAAGEIAQNNPAPAVSKEISKAEVETAI